MTQQLFCSRGRFVTHLTHVEGLLVRALCGVDVRRPFTVTLDQARAQSWPLCRTCAGVAEKEVTP